MFYFYILAFSINQSLITKVFLVGVKNHSSLKQRCVLLTAPNRLMTVTWLLLRPAW